MQVNDRLYIINKYGKFLRKITYIKNDKFEFKHGWGHIDEITLNPGSKSKVKYIFKL